jgi:hypothetical protein
MLVYDISNSGGKLPASANWLSPIYHGIVDELGITEPDGSRRDVQDDLTIPQNWQKDFSEYVYSYPKLIELKNRLNVLKKKLDPIHADQQESRLYDQLSELSRAQDELRGNNGVLVRDYGAEIVTNAWLKMFEMTALLKPFCAAKSNKSSGTIFRSFHVAEAPGNFMLAINHRLRTEYPACEWEWLANSYRDLYGRREANSREGYLSDQYRLIADYPNNWLFGADCDGDITSSANIRSFAQEIQIRGGSLQLFTSDVKYVPSNMNYDEEEHINIPVQFGHTLCALSTLSKGGMAILKQFTAFEGPSISMLYLLSCCFKQLRIIKPETSRQANSEIYVVGIDYKHNLTQIQIDKLFNVMNYVRFLNTDAGSPALFRQVDIPQSFVERVTAVETKLTRLQMDGLVRNLEIYEKYHDESLAVVRKDFNVPRQKAAAEWIEKTGIKVLDPRLHMAHQNRRKVFRKGDE